MKMKQAVVAGFTLLLSSAALASRSDELLVPLSLPSEESLLPKASVSREDLRKDIEELKSVFQKGYGGWPVLSEILLGQIFPAMSNLNKEFYSTREFCQHIGRALDAIPDNHLSANFYKSDKCGKSPERKGQVGRNIREQGNIPWGVSNRVIGGFKVPVISITHLPNSRFGGWNGFLEEVRKINISADALVIDLRGNGGGDDTMPTKMAKILYGVEDAEYFPQSPAVISRRQTPEALAVFVNNYAFRILTGRLRGQEPTPDLLETYNEWFDRYLDAKAGKLDPEIVFNIPKVEPDLSKVFRGPIRILIDAECGSSCESTVEALELHPNAKTVGENTAGYVHFGNMGRLWLRHSNVIVAISTQRYEFTDGRFVEKTGYAPKIPVAPGVDAMNIALEDIANEMK